ncbi:small multi-drug export protein [Pontibacter vulgaris]|uniref:small multi-drug export protein n=1 Tax=Pontibacter vulgaris TaxID=2905679 RepID=UPI001FA79931|nr:small multi-drug export protein [Pontibacter vulgaris]
MVKFFGGPVAGSSLGLSYFETFLFTVAGMMTSVVIFSIIGRAFSEWMAKRRREKKEPVFTRKNRRIVQVWQRFGIIGIAFLTPIFLTPILGTVVAALFGAPRKLIFVHMLWSAVLWGAAQTLLVYEFKQLAATFL